MNFVFETNQGTPEADAFLMYGNILETIMDNLLGVICRRDGKSRNSLHYSFMPEMSEKNRFR